MIGEHNVYLAVIFGMWAFLWCGPLTEPGQVFAPVRSWITGQFKAPLTPLDEVLLKIIVGCAKCHAGQIALWYQVTRIFGTGFDISFIIISISTAHILETWKSRR